MDPFRDELAAAHAKIAQLEDQVHQLEHAARKTIPPRAKNEPERSFTLVIAVMLIAFVVAGVGGVCFLLLRGAAASTDPSFRGIATAVPPQDRAAAVPPIVQPGSVAATAASASASSKPKACNCTPGDPLCTCL